MAAETPGGEKKAPGRTAFEPTDAERATVRDMVRRGAQRSAIAAAIGVSLPTLRKAFAAELAAASEPTLFTAPLPAPPSAAPRAEPRAGGRKRWKPTQWDRDRVMTMIGGGAKVSAVAAILKISEPTLRRAFAMEIEQAADIRQAEIIEAMYRTAKAGNVAAQKEYVELCRRSKFAPQPVDAPSAAATARPGKKEQREAAANAVTGKFAPPPPPRNRAYN